jgi:hypothetical protein
LRLCWPTHRVVLDSAVPGRRATRGGTHTRDSQRSPNPNGRADPRRPAASPERKLRSPLSPPPDGRRLCGQRVHCCTGRAPRSRAHERWLSHKSTASSSRTTTRARRGRAAGGAPQRRKDPPQEHSVPKSNQPVRAGRPSVALRHRVRSRPARHPRARAQPSGWVVIAGGSSTWSRLRPGRGGV